MDMIKKICGLLLLAITLGGCQSNPTNSTSPAEWSNDDVMYEMNVRQLTPEGTFAAAQEYLPQLNEMGVDMIWLMPIYPIGVEARKGTLGSYYAISDYCAINPEFGTLADFDKFVAAAHELGMTVIIDWVANHTSRDSKWLSEQDKDWFVRDSLGEAVSQFDWTDVAKLNFENQHMRQAMVGAMQFWIDRGVDGFRCDMADLVPIDFWQEAVTELKRGKLELFMLAEAETPALHQDIFNASYGWSWHHLMNAIAKGEKSPAELYDYIKKDSTEFPTDAIRLMFTSNHDENSWSGTEFERMGDAATTFAALTYILPQSMPLIYTGQEVGFNRRFEFFEKDPIDSLQANEFTALYAKLNLLRHNNPALASGEMGGIVTTIPTSDELFTIVRDNGENSVISIFNLSSQEIKAEVDLSQFAGTYKDHFTGENIEIAAGYSVDLAPWQFVILTK